MSAGVSGLLRAQNANRIGADQRRAWTRKRRRCRDNKGPGRKVYRIVCIHLCAELRRL